MDYRLTGSAPPADDHAIHLSGQWLRVKLNWLYARIEVQTNRQM